MIQKGKPCGKGWISPKKKCAVDLQQGNKKNPSFFDGYFARAKAIKAESNRIRRDKKESAVIVDNRSGEVVYRGRSGTATSCSIKNPSQLKGNVLLHNHPTHVNGGRSQSFSREDIDLAASYETKAIHAVNEQYEYVMKPPIGGWSESFYERKVAPSYNKHKKAEQKAAVSKVLKGEIKTNWLGIITDKDYDPYHEIWTKVAEDTRMRYRKTPVRNRRDSLMQKKSRLHSDLDKVSGEILSRAFPMRVLDVQSKAKQPNKVSGLFMGADKKTYTFDIDIDRSQLSYQLNTFLTPKTLMRQDSKRKTPDCKVGTPCKGGRGVGCISKRKKCNQKLNRYSTAQERTKLKTLAQEDFNVQVELSTEDQLRKKTIRELQVIAKEQADIPRSHHYTKEQLVKGIARIKDFEDTLVGTGSKTSSAEDEMRKTLNRRENRRKEFLDVKPIDTDGSSIPMSRSELAEKRATEQLKKRREQALKRGFSVLFPGGSKVIDDFSKAITTEDTVIAGLVAGVVALRLYNSGKKEYDQNYKKSVEKEGREAVYGDKMVPAAKQDLEAFYEEPSLSMAEGVKYADEISDRELKKRHISKGLDDSSVKDALKDIKEGGNKEDTLPYQVDKFKGRIKKEATKNMEKAKENLLKQERRKKIADALAKEAVTRNKPIENERSRLRAEIDRINNEFSTEEARKKAVVNIQAPISLRKSESFNKIENMIGKLSPEQQEQVKAKREKLVAEGRSENDIKNEMDDYTKVLVDKSIVEALGKEESGKLTYGELIQSEKSLNSLLSNNLVPNQNALARRASVARALVLDAEDKMETATREWGAIANNTEDGKTSLEKKSLKAAQDEIADRRSKGIATKPLIPDFGEVKGGKLSRYQAWALTNYLEDRRLNKLKANSEIQSDKRKYSLEEFKKKNKGLIVVGSESGKGEEAAKIISGKIPSLNNAYVRGLENKNSKNAAMGESPRGIAPYIERAGKYTTKAIPSGNNIPGFDPAKANNDDATRIAAQIIAMNEYGIPPRVVAHGVGGNILREAMDIVAASKDPKALDNTKVVIFGSPRLGLSNNKEVRERDHVFYGSNDYIARQLGGKGKELIAGVKGDGYRDYLNSSSAISEIEKILK